MSTDSLNKRISSAIKNISELPTEVSEEISFHMTDWSYDLQSLHNMLINIDNKSDKEIYDTILKFLIHAPEHIARASELMTGSKIEGIFVEYPKKGHI